MQKIIVGLSGRKNSGKNTVASYINNRIRDEFNINDSSVVTDEWSFAAPLKAFLINVMGLLEQQCYGSDNDKNSITKYLWDNLPMSVRLDNANETAEMPVAKDFDHVKFCEIMDLPRSGYMTARELMQIFGTDVMRNMFNDSIWVDATLKEIHNYNMEKYIAVISDVRFVSEVEAILSCENGFIIRLLRKPYQDSHKSEIELDNYDFSKYGNKALVLDNGTIGIDAANLAAYDFVVSKLKE